MRAFLLTLSLFLVVLVPFLPLVLWSISEQWFYPDLLPSRFGFRAWTYVVDTAGSQILGGGVHSFLVAAATAALSLLLGLPAGRALGLYAFPGKRLVALVLLLPIIVPPLSIAMGIHLWFLRLELAETFWGVVFVHLTFSLPYAVFVLWGVFADYNPDFEEQARCLGASRLYTLYGVMLPLILPGVAVAVLFAMLLSWSQYLSTLIIGGGRVLTLPILLFSLMDSGDRPVAAAVSLVFVLPALLALMASAQYLGRRGLTGIR